MCIDLHQPAFAFRSLPSATPAARRLAAELKLAKMPHLAIPGRTLPRSAA